MAGEKQENGRLSFTSDQFDPSYALKSLSSAVVQATANSKVFNNLSKYVEGTFHSASFRSLNWFPSVILEDCKKKWPNTKLQDRSSMRCIKNAAQISSVKRSHLAAQTEDDSPFGNLGAASQNVNPCSLHRNEAESSRTEMGTESKGIKIATDAARESNAQQKDVPPATDRISRLKKLMTSDLQLEQKSTRKQRLRPNVLERMEGFKEGPLSILYNCMTKGLKLKVWTKRHTGFRGVCIGYLIAFDKHMNLAMIDVDELYTIETRDLSCEEQYQMKRKKRAMKRNRNRLNRIRREMTEVNEEGADLISKKHVEKLRESEGEQKCSQSFSPQNKSSTEPIDGKKKEEGEKEDEEEEEEEEKGEERVGKKKKRQRTELNDDSALQCSRSSMLEKQNCHFIFCGKKKSLRFPSSKPEFHVNSSDEFRCRRTNSTEMCRFEMFGRPLKNELDKPEALARNASLKREITEKALQVRKSELVNDHSSSYGLVKLETCDWKQEATLKGLEMLGILDSARCMRDPRLRKAKIEYDAANLDRQRVSSSDSNYQRCEGVSFVKGAMESNDAKRRNILADSNIAGEIDVVNASGGSSYVPGDGSNQDESRAIASNRNASENRASNNAKDNSTLPQYDGWAERMLDNALSKFTGGRSKPLIESEEDIEMKQSHVSDSDIAKKVTRENIEQKRVLDTQKRHRSKEGTESSGMSGFKEPVKVLTEKKMESNRDTFGKSSQDRTLLSKSEKTMSVHRGLDGSARNYSQSSSGYVFKRRHINQLFIRGDKIAIVAHTP